MTACRWAALRLSCCRCFVSCYHRSTCHPSMAGPSLLRHSRDSRCSCTTGKVVCPPIPHRRSLHIHSLLPQWAEVLPAGARSVCLAWRKSQGRLEARPVSFLSRTQQASRQGQLMRKAGVLLGYISFTSEPRNSVLVENAFD